MSVVLTCSVCNSSYEIFGKHGLQFSYLKYSNGKVICKNCNYVLIQMKEKNV